MQSMIDPAAREKCEEIVPASWLDADPEMIAKAGGKRREKFLADANGRLGALMAGCTDRNECRRLARSVSLDSIPLDGKQLHGGTGLDYPVFFYLAACLEGEIRRNKKALPLLRNGVDARSASDRGSRCYSLAAEHMLCMVLYHIWTGCAQEALQGVFGIDQTTASRNIRMARGIMADAGILPTDRAVANELSEASPDKAMDATEGGISVDWTHVTIEKPSDMDPGSGAHSGKAHATTCKIMVGCAGSGMILFRGPAIGGRGSEIEYLREHVPSAGHVTASLTDPATPPEMRITVNLDGGPQGAEGVLGGADVRMPHRKPRNGQLTRDQTDYNARLAGRRTMIENNIAGIKAHRILGNVFRGSVAELEETFSVVTGIVNLKRIMGQREWRAPDTHRKNLRQGTKNPRPRGRKLRDTFAKKKEKGKKKKRARGGKSRPNRSLPRRAAPQKGPFRPSFG